MKTTQPTGRCGLTNPDGSVCYRVLFGGLGFVVFTGAVLCGGTHPCLDTLGYISGSLLLSKTADFFAAHKS